MEIDLNTTIKALDGKEIPSNDEIGKPMTYGEVLVTACNGSIEKLDKDETITQRMVRGELGEALFKNRKGKFLLSPEHIVLLKTRVHEAYPSVIICRQVIKAMDPSIK